MIDTITLPRELVERLVASWGRDTKAFIDSMDTLRTALAAPRPEPVAWMRKEWSPDCGSYFDFCAEEEMGWRDRKEWTPLYAAPPAPAPCLEVTVDPRMTPDEAAAISSALAAPKQEPVAYFDLQKQVFFWAKPTMIDVPMTVALKPLPLYAAPPALAATKQEPVALAHCPYTPPPSAHFGYVLGDHWLETAYSRVLDGEAEAEVLKDCGWERVTDAEALRRDAERYRWLRGEHSRIDPCIKANAKYKLERQSSTWVEIHDLDAAIDAAMGDKA